MQQHGPWSKLAPDGVTIVTGAAKTGLPYPPAPAASLLDLTYFEENGGGGGPRGLYNFNSATGTSTLRIGVGGTERLFALATHPKTGVTYGVDPGRGDLFTIDPNTGTITLAVHIAGVTTVANITFDPATGRLYGSERNSPQRLYAIDIFTGTATTVGTMLNVRSGLTFAPNGTLYGVTLTGALYKINPLTAAETLVGGGGGPSLAEDGTARADGVLFVTDYGGSIFRIDPLSGANTLVGNSGSGNGLLGIVPSPSRCRLVAAVEAVRAGTPPNPSAFLPGVTSRPIVGAVWDPRIDHTSFLPGAVIDALAIGASPLNLGTQFGTLLCNVVITVTNPGPGTPFTIPVPDDCGLVGASICTQGASSNGVVIALTNALDLTIGSF